MQLASPPPIFSLTADSILPEAQQLVEQARSVHDAIASDITPDTATFDNTLRLIAEEQSIRIYAQHMLEFHQHVSPDKAVRQASRDAEKRFSDLDSELAMRDDIALLVKAVCDKREDLDEECRRFLNKQMLKYKRNGLHLPLGKRELLQQIKKELAELKVEFEKNMSEESGGLWFTTEALDGLPKDILAGLSTDDRRMHRLTFQWSHVNPALQYVRNADIRRQIYLGHINRCNQNVPLLEKAIILRDEAARLLGYVNHAEYRLEDKMESSPQKVDDFLHDLRVKLIPAGQYEFARLRQLKAEDLEERGEEDDGKFYLWDRALYSRLLVQRDYAIDREKVAEYFPLESTIAQVLEIFAKLFGLAFRRVDTHGEEKLTWHEDVRMFAVYDDHEDDGEEKEDFLGYLYMDLHPRPGKFPGIVDLSIHPGYTSAASKRFHPCTALITHFPKSLTAKPTCITHSDLWQFCHELGHGLHDLVSKTRFACFHGPATAQDFCEAPSQMLEKFCWTPEVLKQIGKHWSGISDETREVWRREHGDEQLPSETMPDELIDALVKSRAANRAMFWLQSLTFAVFDMTVHRPKSHDEVRNLDTTKLWNSLTKDIMGMDCPEGDEWGHGQAVLGHMFSGYDAEFHSYLTSQVYACDMFYSKFANEGDGVLNREEGMKWRREVLEKGGSRDEMEGIRRFLGREARPEAFMRELGLTQ